MVIIIDALRRAFRCIIAALYWLQKKCCQMWTRAFVWLALATVGVLALLLAPIGFGDAEWRQALENSGHAPMFAVLAALTAHWLRAQHVRRIDVKNAYSAAFAFAVALGGLGELLQGLTPTRDPEWMDLFNDALGAVAGLAAYALWMESWPRRARRALFAAICAVLLAEGAQVATIAYSYWVRWSQFPELATFQTSAGHHFMRAEAAESGVAQLPARWARTPGERCFYVSPVADGQWVGAGVKEPWPDWREYSRLSLDLVNPVAQPIALTLRIDDALHNHEYSDRYNRDLQVAAESRVALKVDLDAVRHAPASRPMDMSSIALVLLFQDRTLGAQPFYLCGVKLERD